MGSSAQATVVYQKGSSIYAASNSGKGTKMVIAHRYGPLITPDGQTVIYSAFDGHFYDKFFKIGVTGGASTEFGGEASLCDGCSAFVSPDNQGLAVIGSEGDVSYVPLNDGATTPIATGLGDWLTFSPDGKQIAFEHYTPIDETTSSVSLQTIPVTGGPATMLALEFALHPVWTDAGIVATTAVFLKGKRPQYRVVLLDSSGLVKRVLQRKTFKSVKASLLSRSIPNARWAAGPNVVTIARGKRSTTTLQLIDAASGRVRAKRTFKRGETVRDVDHTGSTILVAGKHGRLQTISFRSGKRVTLAAKGVADAHIS